MPHGAVPFPFGDCRVCSDKATGLHYGVATCEGCKGFFKRSIPKADRYKCFFGGNCVISPQNRNRCKCCRFQRCVKVGMAIEAVKMGRIPKVDKERALQEYGAQVSTSPQVEPPNRKSDSLPPSRVRHISQNSRPITPMNNDRNSCAVRHEEVNHELSNQSQDSLLNHVSPTETEQPKVVCDNFPNYDTQVSTEGLKSEVNQSHPEPVFDRRVWQPEKCSTLKDLSDSFMQRSPNQHDHSQANGEPWCPIKDELTAPLHINTGMFTAGHGSDPDDTTHNPGTSRGVWNMPHWLQQARSPNSKPHTMLGSPDRDVRSLSPFDQLEGFKTQGKRKRNPREIGDEYVTKTSFYVGDGKRIASDGHSLCSSNTPDSIHLSSSSQHSSQGPFSPTVINEILTQIVDSGQGHELERTLKDKIQRADQMSRSEPLTDAGENMSLLEPKDAGVKPAYGIVCTHGSLSSDSSIHQSQSGMFAPSRGADGSKRDSTAQSSDAVPCSWELPTERPCESPHEQHYSRTAKQQQATLNASRLLELQDWNRHPSRQSIQMDANSNTAQHSRLMPSNGVLSHADNNTWEQRSQLQSMSHDLSANKSHDPSATTANDTQLHFAPVEYHDGDDSSKPQVYSQSRAESKQFLKCHNSEVHAAPVPTSLVSPQQTLSSLQSMEINDAVNDFGSTPVTLTAQDLDLLPRSSSPQTESGSASEKCTDGAATPNLHIPIDNLKETLLHFHTKELKLIRRAERLMMLDVEGKLPKHPINNLTTASRKQVQFIWDQLMASVPLSNTMVIGLCSSFPGFNMIPVSDQAILIREGYYEVWLITHSSLFYQGESYLRFPCNGCYSRWWMNHILPDTLVNKMFDFTEGLNDCNLQPVEVLLLCAIQLINPDREGLTNADLIRDINNRYLDILAYIIEENHRPSHGRILVRIFRLLPNLAAITKQQTEVVGNFKVDSFPEEIVFTEDSLLEEDQWHIDLKFSPELDPPEEPETDQHVKGQSSNI